MKKLSYLLLASGLFIAACQRDVELNVPGEDPKIVVNGVLMQDSLFRVQLSESRFVLDIRPQTIIENASLKVFEEAQERGSWAYVSEGVYEAQGFKPAAGKRYQLQVSAPNLAPVVAEATVPAALPNVRVISVDSTINFEEKQVRVRLQISDPAASTDFYVIRRVVMGVVIDGPDGEPVAVYAQLTSESPAVFSTCGDDWGWDNTGCKILVNDRTFEGKDRELIITYRQYIYEDGHREPGYLVVSRVSEDYYRYLLSLYHNSVTEDNPFAEPVPIFMNVSDGYGIPGASSSSWHYIQ